jgi:branched-chain amino acid transport system substrate-binding protein
VRRALSTVALAGVLASALVASAVAQAPIRIGEINSYSGVGAAFTAPYRAAVEMAVDEINAKGGVLGRKIEVMFRDDKLRPDEGIKHAQALLFQQKVDFLMGTFSSAVGLAVAGFAVKSAPTPISSAACARSGSSSSPRLGA